jgi:hypothetical protein
MQRYGGTLRLKTPGMMDETVGYRRIGRPLAVVGYLYYQRTQNDVTIQLAKVQLK